ncbi:head maturation protease, ClpP-related [Lactobacillus sp.]|uniref:head maturation protease, ClpP-related n=1 Tax=Lactobacillus sp. TaxID=1591 RepID=UPI0025BE0BE2|nr:head maturation protease, ClpP-related [Lactobacillus sp.]
MKIQMKGPVIDDEDGKFMEFFGMGDAYIYPSRVNAALDEADGKDVVIEINSPGGLVASGSEIYTALTQYSGNVEAHIVGDAASAGSIIAMGADEVLMSPTAQMMIHRASGGAQGNTDNLHSVGQALDEIDKSLVNIYAAKTGKDKQEIYNMLCKETWMNAETAVNEGFADGILESKKKSDEAEPIFNTTVPIPHLDSKKRKKFNDFLHKEKAKKENKNMSQLRDKKLALLFGKGN